MKTLSADCVKFASYFQLTRVWNKENGQIDPIAYQFTEAWIDNRNALVVGSPNIEIYSSTAFPKGVYHKYDYSFFFNNLKANVGIRISAFLEKKWKLLLNRTKLINHSFIIEQH